MTATLLSDVEARAEARRTRTRDAMWQDLTRSSWTRAQSAASPAESLRWLERAHRLLPEDGTIAISLATALLRGGADRHAVGRAAGLFRAVLDRHDVIEAWSGLAMALQMLGDVEQARAAMATLLRCSAATEHVRALAAAVIGSEWCGLTLDGALWTGRRTGTQGRQGSGLQVHIDRRPVRLRWTDAMAWLPDGWQDGQEITVVGAGSPLAGSPLPIPRLLALEGVVEAVTGGIVGWAWHPADPEHVPVVRATGPLGHLDVELSGAADVEGIRPLARPRAIHLPPETCGVLGVPIEITGPGGRLLLGSPIDPGIEARAAADPHRVGFAPVWADIITTRASLAPLTAAERVSVTDVVIPVYSGRAETLACLDAVLAGLPRGTRIIVVDDASPDAGLVSDLLELARLRRIVLVRLARNRGFPGAANAGIARAARRDVVLLNSDTLVAPGWLERLRAVAYSSPEIGTVSPLSNDATILSYPSWDGGNPVPGRSETASLDRLAQRANGIAAVDIPVGVGFCLYLKRQCLDAVGLFREDLFAQGYGEENDLCLRTRHAGFRNVAATGVFVAHVGGTSFGAARAHLVRRNGAILNRLHPGYDALVADHIRQNPLAPARMRMDVLLWRKGRCPGSVIFVTHDNGGGVERVVRERAAAVTAQGMRAIVLRPAKVGGGFAVHVGTFETAFPNLIFPIAEGMPALVRLLRPDRPSRVELHHMQGHAHEIAGLARWLGVEAVSIIHDYARFCPRIALVGTGRRYCGEPAVPGCEACIDDLGSLMEDDLPVRTLLARSGAELAEADRVIAPSRDAARRISRHFSGVSPEVVPWEVDATVSNQRLTPVASAAIARVIVVGAIGTEKGYDVLLACVRDARARGLTLEFVVVGFTADDERLMRAGPAFVTGEYSEPEARRLIEDQRGHVALIPSIWPETWCFALTRAWEAGLQAVVFDLGAQAERVRATGRGTVLPLGLEPSRVNDALLRLAMPEAASQCPPVSAA